MPPSTPLNQIIQSRLSRRDLLKGSVAGGSIIAMSGLPGLAWSQGEARDTTELSDPTSFSFTRIGDEVTQGVQIADGYTVQPLLKWGDPLFPHSPVFDPTNQTPEAQLTQFGYNNDFVEFMPLPLGSDNANHGLLCVNHEYTSTPAMFPLHQRHNRDPKVLARLVGVEMAAQGHSIVEIRREQPGSSWEVLRDSRYNRRISTLQTAIEISGPAAGDEQMKTAQDPTGKLCIGTMSNCSGGVTPWGTLLLGEENFNYNFSGEPEKTEDPSRYLEMGIRSGYGNRWYMVDPRFNINRTPNESNRFGWVVEVDPYNPDAPPIKRTALGRFKHEAATCATLPDGRLAIYSGDDSRHEFLYRFVTRDAWNPQDRSANKALLDHGILSVAKFEEDGSLTWLPLIQGDLGLTPENGFKTQADVLIRTRKAARQVGATPMDRPEDVQPHPKSGKVYVALTNNTHRRKKKADGANPRGPNYYGHILELTPPDQNGQPDHGSDHFQWNILLMGGPFNKKAKSQYNAYTEKFGNWLAAPDNFAFDGEGRLWIATDQGSQQHRRKHADGLYACDLEGPGRALTKRFLGCPVGAELCGPAFTPDDTTLFVSIQHPGEKRGATYENPLTRWPDFEEALPPRPSVIAIQHKDKKKIGS
ncbi:PhoX family protein [Magnetococcus sp. PR-3]|uniref:PhoX family protein n=1 Tax=Magnetococcus sp. PR-3 TaxID=3120355 RepID=UPI002FCE0088